MIELKFFANLLSVGVGWVIMSIRDGWVYYSDEDYLVKRTLFWLAMAFIAPPLLKLLIFVCFN